jgi:hypothetical protein
MGKYIAGADARHIPALFFTSSLFLDSLLCFTNGETQVCYP